MACVGCKEEEEEVTVATFSLSCPTFPCVCGTVRASSDAAVSYVELKGRAAFQLQFFFCFFTPKIKAIFLKF